MIGLFIAGHIMIVAGLSLLTLSFLSSVSKWVKIAAIWCIPVGIWLIASYSLKEILAGY